MREYIEKEYEVWVYIDGREIDIYSTGTEVPGNIQVGKHSVGTKETGSGDFQDSMVGDNIGDKSSPSQRWNQETMVLCLCISVGGETLKGKVWTWLVKQEEK